MGLRIARFSSEDGNGYVYYDSVTMYVYPVRIKTRIEAEVFASWVLDTTKFPINEQSEDIYALYERFYETVVKPREERLQEKLSRLQAVQPDIIIFSGTPEECMELMRRAAGE